MFKKILLLLLAAGMSLSACGTFIVSVERNPRPTQPPTQSSTPLQTKTIMKNPFNGRWQVVFIFESNTKQKEERHRWFTFILDARQHNGIVSGTLKMVDSDGGGIIKGTVNDDGIFHGTMRLSWDIRDWESLTLQLSPNGTSGTGTAVYQASPQELHIYSIVLLPEGATYQETPPTLATSSWLSDAATKQVGLTQTAMPTPTRDLRITSTPGLFSTSATIQAGRSVYLTSLRMVNALAGWATGDYDRILRTADGGSTWWDVTPDSGHYLEDGFFALDSQEAWAVPTVPLGTSPADVPNQVTIWHTTNGGLSWQPSNPLCVGSSCNFFDGVNAEYFDVRTLKFIDSQNGWMLVSIAGPVSSDNTGGHITSIYTRVYRTYNGGMDWAMEDDTVRAPALPGYPMDIAFLDTQVRLLGFSDVYDIEAAYPDSPMTVYYSRDAGSTWAPILLAKPTVLPVDFSTRKGVCGTINITTLPPLVIDISALCRTEPRVTYYRLHFHSPDGGLSWNSWMGRNLKNFPWYNDVEFLDANLGWRILDGENNLFVLEKTRNSGSTWELVSSMRWFGDLEFVTELNGWALAHYNGSTTLVHTTDGGRTWAELNPIIPP